MGIYIKGFKMPEGGYRTIEIAYDADGHPMALADGGDVFDVFDVIPADVRPRWIPVAERLPKEWWPVLGLIQFHNEKEPPAQEVLWYLGNGHWRETWRGDMIENDVTHWMPLPELPELPEEENNARKIS